MNKISKISIFIGLFLLLSFMVIKPIKTHAQTDLFDGGMVMEPEIECDCQGEGMDITVQSYVDESTHTYLYMPGATQLFMNFDIESPGNFFLTTLEPVGVCMVGADPYCDDDSPDGVFMLTGTSLKLDRFGVVAKIKKLPGIKELTKTVTDFMATSSISSSLKSFKLPKLST